MTDQLDRPLQRYADTHLVTREELLEIATDAVLLGANAKDPELAHPLAADMQRRRFDLADISNMFLEHRRQPAETRGEALRRAISSGDLPAIVSGVAAAITGSLASEQRATSDAWTAVALVPNFLSMGLRSCDVGTLPEIQEGGDLATLPGAFAGNEAALRSFGGPLLLSRQLLLDTTAPDLVAWVRAITATARRRQDELAYSLLDDNANLADGSAAFAAGFGNLLTGQSSLSVTSLGAAAAALRAQTGPAGATIDAPIRHLLVAPDLEPTAQVLAASLAAAGQAAPIQVHASGHLSTGVFYVLADPRTVAPVRRMQLQFATDPLFIETKNPHTTASPPDGVIVDVRLDVNYAFAHRSGIVRAEL